MDVGTNQMETMLNICQKELKQLLVNMDRFLKESSEFQKLSNVNGRRNAAEGLNMFALIAFDSYLTQLSTVTTMARKLNIHLQLNAMPKSALHALEPLESSMVGGDGIGSSISKSRLYHDVLRWSSSVLMGRELDEQLSENLSIAADCKSQEGLNREKLKGKLFGNNITSASNLDEYLQSIMPTKDISHFKEGHEFSASITYVKDSTELIFFVLDMNDYPTLLEISNESSLVPKQHSDAADKVFYITQSREKSGTDREKNCAWRGVMVPGDFSNDRNTVLLIDFGETITLDEQCKLYEIRPKLAEIPPLAVKCIFQGVCDSEGHLTTDHEKCKSVLLSHEFKMANFRVLSQESRVLRVVLIDLYAEKFSSSPSTAPRSKTNPFIDTTLLDEDGESDENNHPVTLCGSALCGQVTPANTNHSSKVGHKLQVTVTHVISPIQFYAMIEDTAKPEICEVFFWSDEEISPEQKNIYNLRANDIILARYIKDDQWYRAKIVKIIPGQSLYEVFYIDFGNTEIVPQSSVASCNAQQMEMPPQAFSFRLEGIKLKYPPKDLCSDGGTNDEANNKLQKATEAVVVVILNQTLNVEVVDQQPNDEIVVRLEEQFSFISSMLLNMGVVVKEL